MPVDDITRMKRILGEVYLRPCKCVSCSECKGKGTICLDDNLDDYYAHETCESCDGGVSETCDRCQEAEELEEQINEMEYRGSTK